MVGMFVSKEDAGEVFGGAADGGEALANLARAEPGIDEDAGGTGFEVGAIPGGTAAEDGKLNRHRGDINGAGRRGQFFCAQV